MSPKTVLVTGSNGFLGSAICLTFVRAGWSVFGLTRKSTSIPFLLRNEITPILTGPAGLADLSFLDDKNLPVFDVVVSTSEDLMNYEKHFGEVMALCSRLAERRKKEEEEGSGRRLLVLFTSGCKDYGMTGFHGQEGLEPHVETSPLRPPPLVEVRTKYSLTVLEKGDVFDAVVTRPTTFYGRSGSFYAPLFGLAEDAKERGGGVLRIKARPDSILHGTHIDDVASAYLAIAEAERDIVRGQIYNISGKRYETLEEIAAAVEKSYGIKVEYEERRGEGKMDTVDLLFNFSQWVGSDKIRRDLGWTDKRQASSDGFEIYSRAYEQAVKDGDEGVANMNRRVEFSKLSKEEQQSRMGRVW